MLSRVGLLHSKLAQHFPSASLILWVSIALWDTKKCLPSHTHIHSSNVCLHYVLLSAARGHRCLLFVCFFQPSFIIIIIILSRPLFPQWSHRMMASQRPPSGMARPMSRSGSVLPGSAKPTTAVRPPTAIRVGTAVRNRVNLDMHTQKYWAGVIENLSPFATDGPRYGRSPQYEGLHHQNGSSIGTHQSDWQASDPAGTQWDEDGGERWVSCDIDDRTHAALKGTLIVFVSFGLLPVTFSRTSEADPGQVLLPGLAEVHDQDILGFH